LKQRLRILIVEDSKLQALMLRKALVDLGMVAECAFTLAEGLQLLQDKHFDAVMLDLHLTDSVGLDTLIQLQAAQPTLPIIVLTATDQDNLSHDVLQSGAEDFLIKGEPSGESISRSLRYAIERKRQSTKIYESEKRLRAIIDSSYNAFIAVSSELNIVEWNNQAANLFGYSQAEAAEDNFIETIFPTVGDLSLHGELSKHLGDEPSGLVNKPCQIMARHRGGRLFAAEVAFFQVGHGDSARLCSFITDITDRIAFEKHASELYSTVAHELRAPLTSIRGSLGILRTVLEQPVPPEAEDVITIGSDSCTRLIKLVGDLLDLRKYEVGKMRLALAANSLNELISTAVASCKDLAPEKNLRIKQKLAEDVVLQMDRDRMMQVLINYLSNAVKFSPVEGVIDIEVNDEREGHVRVSVIDRGPGIAAEHLPKLFEKFPQIDNSGHSQLVASDIGTGLGLAICKAIVAEHKGDVGAASVQGQGATFWFELPLSTN